MSVNIEFEKPITAEQARAAMRAFPGIQVVDKREDGGYVTPIESAGEDAVFISRVRKDPTVEHGPEHVDRLRQSSQGALR